MAEIDPAARSDFESSRDPANEGPEVDWYKVPADDTAAQLGSDRTGGLTDEEARRRLERDGPNALRQAKSRPWWAILIAQFRSLIVILLLIATGIALVLGDTFEAYAILVVILLNALIGFFTEARAQQAIDALQKQTVPTAHVVRNGREKSVPAAELVVGDLVVLETGARVPADGRIVSSASLQAQEAALTGESVPVEKSSSALADDGLPLGDRRNMAYLGTNVTAGRGLMLVTATGMSTEVGKIGALLEESVRQETPMERRLDQLSRTLVWVVAGLSAIIVLLGYLRGFEILYMLEVGISLAIAAVPEGLPAVTTMTLALGVQRMARANALVRRLPAVETLGSTTVICTDKTGTLTENEMTVTRLLLADRRFDVTGTGYTPRGTFEANGRQIDPLGDPPLQTALTIGALCNDATLVVEDGEETVLGDPTDGALIVAAAKAGLDDEELERERPRVDEIPFDSAAQRMVTVHRLPDGQVVAYAKGAPGRIVERSANILTPEGTRQMRAEDREHILELNRAQAAEALRVLALAYRELPEEYERSDLEEGLTFAGLICMIDPVRQEAVEAVRSCREAGIRTVMITGDQVVTASAIARELGIDVNPDGEKMKVVHARELEGLGQEEWEEVASHASVFARVSPEHKLRIVEALQRQGQVVAMTGDGVNDAPALRRADIGVAMGVKGTDVAKEAAAMILGDDNFATIVRAVEQGRVIYANVLRFIQFLFSCNLSEILTVFVAIMVGLPLPLVALQILWLNIVTDVFPAMALALEPASGRIMEQKPRDPKESLLTPAFAGLVAWQGVLLAAVTLGAFLVALDWYGAGDGLARAVTISFMTLALAQVFHMFSVRSNSEPLVSAGLFRNGWIWLSLVVCVLLQLAAVYVPVLQRALSTVPLAASDWGLVLGFALAPVVLISLIKRVTGGLLAHT